MYQAIKHYGHDEGWSCTYRQHRAVHSHCRFIHGYSLAFEFVFECEELDERDWVVDFGGLRALKHWLQSTFDHRMLVAEDDPQIELYREMAKADMVDIVFVAAISCEKFAEMAFYQARSILRDMGQRPRVRLISVKVSEHLGNSGVFSA